MSLCKSVAAQGNGGFKLLTPADSSTIRALLSGRYAKRTFLKKDFRLDVCVLGVWVWESEGEGEHPFFKVMLFQSLFNFVGDLDVYQ